MDPNENSVSLLGLSELMEVISVQKLLDDYSEVIGCDVIIENRPGNLFLSTTQLGLYEIMQCEKHDLKCLCDESTEVMVVETDTARKVFIKQCKKGFCSASASLWGTVLEGPQVYFFGFFLNEDQKKEFVREFSETPGDPLLQERIDQMPILGLRKLGFISENLLSVAEIVYKLGRVAIERRKTQVEQRDRALVLEQSEKSYRTLVGNIPAVVYRCDLTPPWRMHYISDVITQLSGYTPEVFLKGGNMAFEEIIMAEDRPKVTEAVAKALDENRHYEMEYRIIDKERNVLWVFERGRFVFDEKGTPQYLDGVIMDITEKKLSQLARAEADMRFKALFDNMSEGVALHKVIYDESGLPVNYLIYDINAAYTEHTGLTREAVVGKLATEAYGSDEVPYLDEFSGTVVNRTPLVFDTFYSGLNRHFHISVFSILPHQFATVFLDITSTVRDQEQLTLALEERKVLIREIHHRVKNNLAAMILLIEKHIEESESETSVEFLKDLRSQAFTMALIYDQLNHTQRLSKIEMSQYFEELAANIASSLNKMGWLLTTVECDEIWMDVSLATPCAMIVNELITNVYKYAFPTGWEGDRHLLIRLMKREDVYRLSVRDNGIGYTQNPLLHSGKSYGLELVRLWAEHQLGGTFTMTCDKGVRVEIEFKDRRGAEPISALNE